MPTGTSKTKGSKGGASGANQKDYAIDFSSWETKDIEEYVTQSEYNLRRAKNTLAARKGQTTSTNKSKGKSAGAKKPANAKTAQSSGKKTGAKNTQRTGQKSVNNGQRKPKKTAQTTQRKTTGAVKTNNNANTQKTAAAQPTTEENVNVLIATEGAPTAAQPEQQSAELKPGTWDPAYEPQPAQPQPLQPVQTAPQPAQEDNYPAQSNILPEAAAEFPQMQPEESPEGRVIVEEPAAPVATYAAPQPAVAPQPAAPAPTTVNTNTADDDMEDDNPYAF